MNFTAVPELDLRHRSDRRFRRSAADLAADLTADAGAVRPTLLAIWAHPDDESYLGAGLMAAVAERGGRVVSVTATLGEHGTQDPSTNPPEQLATRRQHELDDALASLGAEGWEPLGHGDGRCDEVADSLGARWVGRVLDAIGPDAVLTFGPDGVTGHPDHRAIGRWVRRAVAERGDRSALVTTAAAEVWSRDLVERMHRVNAFYPGFPAHIRGGRMRQLHLSGGLLDRKMRALAAHRSQIGPLQSELGPADYRRLASLEAYRPANPRAEHLLFGSPTRLKAAA